MDADQASAPEATPATIGGLAVYPPERLGVLVGPFNETTPAQDEIGFYGTDLGVSTVHRGETRIIFGDTWRDERGTTIGPSHDDSQASLVMAGDGGSVAAWLASQQDEQALPVWRRKTLPVAFERDAEGQVAPIELYRGGEPEAPVDLGEAKAVVAAFSDQQDGMFAIFRRDVPVACSGGDAPSCGGGFTCDTGAGLCSNTRGEYRTTCVLGSDRCGALGECEPAPGGGLCQDRTSSVYKEGDEDGRLHALVVQHELGNADPEVPTRYYTRAFVTSKFTNATTRVVADFDPERDDPEDNDYAPADGSGTGQRRVLMWGRPRSVGSKATGRDARLYFAYSDLPAYDATGPVGWEPQYLAAIEAGRPRFSPDQADAMALDLGDEPVAEAEAFDIVDRTSVTYVPALQRWVMLYGGDFAPIILRAFTGPNYGLVERAPTGAIHLRVARHPWGPWSPPVPAFEAGDPDAVTPAAGSEYGPGGVLHHPACSGDSCAPAAPAPIFGAAPYGFFYAPNILEALTEVGDGGRSVDLYWNVSTWHPYQVVLLRTRIQRLD